MCVNGVFQAMSRKYSICAFLCYGMVQTVFDALRLYNFRENFVWYTCSATAYTLYTPKHTHTHSMSIAARRSINILCTQVFRAVSPVSRMNKTFRCTRRGYKSKHQIHTHTHVHLIHTYTAHDKVNRNIYNTRDAPPMFVR